MTQADRVARHLDEVGYITSWQAVQEYGILQLPARIKELERRGRVIPRIVKKAKNRYGESVHFTEYRSSK